MAKDNIVDQIGRSNQTAPKDTSADALTFEQARANYRKRQQEIFHQIEEENIKAQAKLEAALREKGLKETDALWKKLLSDQARQEGLWDELLAKNKKLQALKDLEDTYSYAANLDEALADQRYKTNEAIMKSTFATMEDKLAAFGQNLQTNVQKGLSRGLSNLINGALNDMNGMMSTYAKYQAKINARIQGTGMTYKMLEDNLSGAVGVQPYVRTQSMVENLAALVDSGIAYNMEMRAFIQSMKDNIASTFDATNGTLLRLIRIQQEDSTAARLGLEANLTRYFNFMYQNTEYLSNSFDIVSGALLEASSTMSKNRAVEFEAQVQKWLGSLYGVGVSDETIAGIAQAIGMLGSGNVSGLANSQYQNLLVMAASRAGLSYGELLTGGLNASTTDILLESMVGYLKQIAEGPNKVVQSELGRVFGVSMSDLQSALNLSNSLMKNIASHDVSYFGTMAELLYQFTAMPSRMSISTMMDTLWENLEWSLATNVAKNPALYGIWKVTDMIQQYTGGIAVPSVWAVGNGFSLNTTIENLIKMGVVGIGSLGMIGDLVSGLSSSVAPYSMFLKLQALSDVQSVGRGLMTAMAGMSTSQTTIVGNSSGDDVYSSTKTQAEGEGKKAQADAAANEDTSKVVDTIKDYVSDIRQMIASIITVDGVKVSRQSMYN